VDLVYDDNGTSNTGVGIDLIYEGPVEFVSVSKGDFNCSTFFGGTESVEGTVSFQCWQSPMDSPNFLNDGVLGHFIFSPTATGTVTMALSNPDPDEADSLDGGVYTITGIGGTGGTLPRTALFDTQTVVALSVLLISAGAYIGVKNSGIFRRKRFEDRFNGMYGKL